MSTKKPPPSYGDIEDEVEYVQEDEDEDEEDDFVPGVEEEDAGEEEEEAIVPILEGLFTLDGENLLHYRGEGFHLASTRPVEWNILDQDTKPPKSMCSLDMEGTMDIETVSGKPTFRKMEVTWSVHSLAGLVRPARQGKADPNEEKDDSKMPSLTYNVYGRQVDCSKGEALEFRGSYPPANGKEVSMSAQVRLVPTALAAAAAAKPAPAAAARVDNDEDEDDNDDDGVDYEELIALHEDAGMSVADLKKRYQGQESEKVEASPQKKGKFMPDDDDDSDYGF